MTAPQEERARWTIQDAESLLLSLRGILSARVVTRPGGEIEEIHLLTTDEVTAKQTVRNVESALLAHLDIGVDHRKISVAQTKDRPAVPEPASAPESPVRLVPEPPQGLDRLLFVSHQIETERSHQVKHRVEIEWNETAFVGEASGADLPRGRLEAVTRATLAAVEAIATSEPAPKRHSGVTLALDGVKVVSAFDRDFVLVAIHAMAGRDVTPLAGATLVGSSADRSAILATLQATDRWVRGRI